MPCLDPKIPILDTTDAVEAEQVEEALKVKICKFLLFAPTFGLLRQVSADHSVSCKTFIFSAISEKCMVRYQVSPTFGLSRKVLYIYVVVV